jgi:hypothetical protein
MRVALANPSWDFTGSIYFGCPEPHLPLELGYAAAGLEAEGHEVLLVDGHLAGVDTATLAATIAEFGPDLSVVTTAPTYLFWRCAPPELRSPRALLDALAGRGGRTVAVGPHGSATPGAALHKLGVDVVVRGECEDVLAALAARGGEPTGVAGTAWRTADGTSRDRPPSLRISRRRRPFAGRARGSAGTAIIIIASTRRPPVPAPRSRPRAGAPSPAPSAPSWTTATAIAAARWRRCSRRSTA